MLCQQTVWDSDSLQLTGGGVGGAAVSGAQQPKSQNAFVYTRLTLTQGQQTSFKLR